MNTWHRRRQLVAAAAVLAVLAGGCSSGGGSGTNADTSRPNTSADSSSPGSPTAPTTTTTTAPPKPAMAPYPVPEGKKVEVRPSGFVVTKTPKGAKPPQFVVVSFDGAGWHEKWQFWRSLQADVPFHFTGFLSGTYLLSEATKDLYTGPGHNPGKSSLAWTGPQDVPVEIGDLNEALRRGDEIGTHFNGHFCSGAEPSVGTWSTEQWNSELDQFNSFITNVNANNGIDDELDLKPSDVTGGRTPCLEGSPGALYPAYAAHGMNYDSSFTRQGLYWPTRSPDHGIWQIGMSTFPMFGPNNRPIITMDYNFYYRQHQANSDGVSPEQSQADSDIVLGTYRDMYQAAFSGNRSPVILGNHFEEWNNGAYQNALANFVKETCGKPDTYCVPFHDLVAWMEGQDPAYLTDLQALPPAMGPVPPAPPA